MGINFHVIRQRHKLIDYVPHTLVKVSSTNGGELASPCPFCGGRDRFRVQPNHPNGARWFCRQCSPQWGDIVDYIAKRDGVGVSEAARHLSGGEVPTVSTSDRVTAPQLPTLVQPPDLAWQDATWEIVDACHQALLLGGQWLADNPDSQREVMPAHMPDNAKAWLYLINKRGLTKQTIFDNMLGFSDGSHTWRGITIPNVIDNQLWGVKVRRFAKQGDKYMMVKGSKIGLYGADSISGNTDTLIVCEGEFDAMLLTQYVPNNMAVVTLGGAHMKVSTSWRGYLLGIKRVLLAFDADKAGQAGADKWAEVAPCSPMLCSPTVVGLHSETGPSNAC